MKRLSGKGKRSYSTKHTAAFGPNPAERMAQPAPKEESWWSRLFNMVSSIINVLPTKDPGVNTKAGARPRVDLSGEADPAQSSQYKESAGRQVGEQMTQANAAAQADFGENDIYPFEEKFPKEILRPSVQVTPAKGSEGVSFQEANLPSSVRPRTDAAIQPWYDKQVNEQLAKEEIHRAEYEKKSSEARAEGDRRLAAETESARLEQSQVQEKARGEIANRKKEWMNENSEIQRTYEKQSAEKKEELDKQITKRTQKTEQDAAQKLSNAEKEAQKAKQDAENKAAAEKKKADNQPQSYWEKFKRAVSSAFESIQGVMNSIFEGLRKAVKFIIEGAKQAVRGIIEIGRIAVNGLIQGFGVVLKGLTTVVLAAFPETAAKARAWIDDKVEKATSTVNSIAEKLKKTTDSILDFVGGALDFALSAFQVLNNLILDALQGKSGLLNEILTGIGNLIESAQMMPDQFMGELEKELTGTRFSEPLAFEKREMPSSLEAAPFAQGGGTIPGGPAMTSGADFWNKKTYTDNDIAMTNVPNENSLQDLLGAADWEKLQAGNSIEFGENSNPSNSMEAIKAEFGALQGGAIAPGAAQENAEMTGVSQEGAQSQSGGGQIPQVPKPGESHEAFSDRQLAVMLANQESKACKAQKSEEPATSSAIPESQKIIGPLTRGQRAGYMWEQMKQGVMQWFVCNRGKILLGAIGVLAVGTILTIITGGAFLAALPLLMQIIGAAPCSQENYHLNSKITFKANPIFRPLPAFSRRVHPPREAPENPITSNKGHP